jgi:membrane protein YdbS with pleckstrin-like domain
MNDAKNESESSSIVEEISKKIATHERLHLRRFGWGIAVCFCILISINLLRWAFPKHEIQAILLTTLLAAIILVTAFYLWIKIDRRQRATLTQLKMPLLSSIELRSILYS